MTKPTIMVVDDDPSVTRMLGKALAEDHNVVVASDGFDGLSEVMVGSEKIDLVITDLKMPGLDGIELIENLPEDLPVIVISGYLLLPKFREALKHLHPVAVFEKPLHLDELREAIRKGLGEQ